MKLAAISFTPGGEKLTEDIRQKAKAQRGGFDLMIETYKDRREDFAKASDYVARCFEENIPILFVCACGIAVRLIAPFLKDKLSDPAVIVMDEEGEYVIPILSGHVGGANNLARMMESLTGATAVITTATDVNETFAIDEFAAENRLTINNKDRIKVVSSKAVRGEPIRISIESFPPSDDADVIIAGQNHGDALWLSPKGYVLGIGCKKGKTCKEIETAVQRALDECGLDYKDIYAFGSIDLKAKEAGLLDFSAKYRIPFVTFTSEMLSGAKGDFEASQFVKETTGVDNVCERAAVLLTGNKGELVLGKQARDGVTVAIARR
ncbi:cobalt-precorrin 5A hydrolase [Butyrivibrio sp. FCS014]|uniref:cobalt-precorrin 5A hydrolase n=1 Tax=Butyrivibrio sp. FCS014 TaxID=1408304 RepID=UPI00046563C7|nr:cobalt-precorrin 5A hydrolase [Butyrivibrio sp. FCS014]